MARSHSALAVKIYDDGPVLFEITFTSDFYSKSRCVLLGLSHPFSYIATI
jgi:hypothetical protein